jgi:hypothetical protein
MGMDRMDDKARRNPGEEVNTGRTIKEVSFRTRVRIVSIHIQKQSDRYPCPAHGRGNREGVGLFCRTGIPIKSLGKQPWPCAWEGKVGKRGPQSQTRRAWGILSPRSLFRRHRNACVSKCPPIYTREQGPQVMNETPLFVVASACTTHQPPGRQPPIGNRCSNAKAPGTVALGLEGSRVMRCPWDEVRLPAEQRITLFGIRTGPPFQRRDGVGCPSIRSCARYTADVRNRKKFRVVAYAL